MQSVPGLLQAVASAVSTRSVRELEWNLRSLYEQQQAFPQDVSLHIKNSGTRDDFFAALVTILRPEQMFEATIQEIALLFLTVAAADQDVAYYIARADIMATQVVVKYALADRPDEAHVVASIVDRAAVLTELGAMPLDALVRLTVPGVRRTATVEETDPAIMQEAVRLLDALIAMVLTHMHPLRRQALTLIANFVGEQPGLKDRIKEHPSATALYRSCLALLSDKDVNIIVQSLRVLSSLVLGQPLGEKLFNSNNVHQTFKLIFSVTGKGGGGGVPETPPPVPGAASAATAEPSAAAGDVPHSPSALFCSCLDLLRQITADPTVMRSLETYPDLRPSLALLAVSGLALSAPGACQGVTSTGGFAPEILFSLRHLVGNWCSLYNPGGGTAGGAAGGSHGGIGSAATVIPMAPPSAVSTPQRRPSASGTTAPSSSAAAAPGRGSIPGSSGAGAGASGGATLVQSLFEALSQPAAAGFGAGSGGGSAPSASSWDVLLRLCAADHGLTCIQATRMCCELTFLDSGAVPHAFSSSCEEEGGFGRGPLAAQLISAEGTATMCAAVTLQAVTGVPMLPSHMAHAAAEGAVQHRCRLVRIATHLAEVNAGFRAAAANAGHLDLSLVAQAVCLIGESPSHAGGGQAGGQSVLGGFGGGGGGGGAVPSTPGRGGASAPGQSAPGTPHTPHFDFQFSQGTQAFAAAQSPHHTAPFTPAGVNLGALGHLGGVPSTPMHGSAAAAAAAASAAAATGGGGVTVQGIFTDMCVALSLGVLLTRLAPESDQIKAFLMTGSGVSVPSLGPMLQRPSGAPFPVLVAPVCQILYCAHPQQIAKHKAASTAAVPAGAGPCHLLAAVLGPGFPLQDRFAIPDRDIVGACLDVLKFYMGKGSSRPAVAAAAAAAARAAEAGTGFVHQTGGEGAAAESESAQQQQQQQRQPESAAKAAGALHPKVEEVFNLGHAGAASADGVGGHSSQMALDCILDSILGQSRSAQAHATELQCEVAALRDQLLGDESGRDRQQAISGPGGFQGVVVPPTFGGVVPLATAGAGSRPTTGLSSSLYSPAPTATPAGAYGNMSGASHLNNGMPFGEIEALTHRMKADLDSRDCTIRDLENRFHKKMGDAQAEVARLVEENQVQAGAAAQSKETSENCKAKWLGAERLNVELQRALSEREGQVDALQAQLSAGKGQKQAAGEELNVLRVRMRQLEESTDAAMESTARAEAEKDSRSDAVQEKAARLEETYRKLVLVTKAYQDKEKQVAEAVSAAAGLDDRVSSLQAELETAHASQYERDSERRHLEEQLQQKQAEHQQRGGLMAQLERQAEDALGRLNECRSELLAQAEAKVKAGSELTALQYRFADVERQNDLLTETVRAQGEQLKKTSNIAQLIHNLSAAAGTPLPASESSIMLPTVNEL